MLNPWPFFNQKEINEVIRVLNSGEINYLYGSEGKLFEKEFANYFGINYSICISNGTSALYAAYKAIGLNSGDEIITTPRTFIGTISPAILMGCKPIFADVDLNSGCITSETIQPLITKKTKAICIVHLAGWPADIENVAKLAYDNNISLIEDCSQAHGASFNGKSVGSFGDLSVWSFCTDKIISTGGEGGMVGTNSEEIFNKIWSFKDHGKSYKKYNNLKKDNKFKYLHDDFGLNFRMTEMQSALGRYQLKNLSRTIDLRRRNALILINHLKDVPCISIPTPEKNAKHAFYKLYGYLNFKLIKENITREKIISEIIDRGYPCFVGSCSEIYREDCFKNIEFLPNMRLPNAKELLQSNLQLYLTFC